MLPVSVRQRVLKASRLDEAALRHSSCRWSPSAAKTLCILLQEQQQLLSTYQSLVVKQLMSRKQEEAEEQDEEARGTRAQLQALMPQVKDLVLSQRKTSVNED